MDFVALLIPIIALMIPVVAIVNRKGSPIGEAIAQKLHKGNGDPEEIFKLKKEVAELRMLVQEQQDKIAQQDKDIDFIQKLLK